MITTNYFHQGAGPDPTRTVSGEPRSLKRHFKLAEELMAKIGGTVNSRSGFYASLAINVCETRGYSYKIEAHPGLGYCVERIEPHKP